MTGAAAPGLNLAGIARYTLAFHAALPWVLWGLSLVSPLAPTGVFVGIHVLFPIVLAVSYRLWKGQGTEVALLVVLNHMVTALSGALASALASLL